MPGLRITYEPEHLRFFQARFEGRCAFLDPAETAEVAEPRSP